MPAGTTSARDVRALYRHPLRNLTYVTLDHANGGVVRNISHDGIGIQAVMAMRPRQEVQVRFELKYPRVRVETRGEIVWSTFSGQCGIRLLDLPPRMVRQIDEWIMGNLLEGSIHAAPAGSIFGDAPDENEAGVRPMFGTMLSSAPMRSKAVVDDGLIVSPAPVKVIELPAAPRAAPTVPELAESTRSVPDVRQDWLSQPLSPRSLAWIVNILVVTASLLLSALIFLSVTQELPRWPVATGAAALAVLTILYLGFFRYFAGASLGAKLARLRDSDQEEKLDDEDRFR